MTKNTVKEVKNVGIGTDSPVVKNNKKMLYTKCRTSLSKYPKSSFDLSKLNYLFNTDIFSILK